jgi:PAS domain S-box-containing protein
VQRSERLERDTLLQELALSEARYDEIVERAEALITTLDAGGHILFVNSKAEQLTGAERAGIKGASWLDVFVRKADHETVQALLRRALDERTAQLYEGPLQTARGDHLLRWLFTRLPQSSALCAIGIDVTHEHELGVRARRAERLASLGTMAAGFAHEIRNPLNAAKLQLSVARRRLNGAVVSPQTAEGALEAAELELRRLAVLVDHFLVFARPQPLQLAHADLRSLVGDVLAFLEPEAQAAGVAVQLIPGEPLQLELDTGLIKQVLVNLLRNALEASQPNSQVRVSIERAGAAARLTVEDEGAGFGADAPIFEPFYTTKDRGAGLGLAIAHRIVMDHAGSVEAKSQPGRTLFAVTLPIARPA